MSLISNNDQAVIELLRGRQSMTVEQLIEKLGVTATAIRQRLGRLSAAELIERTQTSQGRGRPKHQYGLTEKGRRTAGNNLEDLAVSLWEEVQQIENDVTKQKVIAGVVKRLAEKYESETDGESVEERMQSITALFAQRKIPIEFKKNSDGLPIVTVSGCPYPDLADENREICDMEKALLAKVVGTPINLCQCQQDGDRCCSFEAAVNAPADHSEQEIQS